MFAWSHTTYALWHDIIFNFEWKWDLDYFLAHAEGAKRIFAVDAYNRRFSEGKQFVRVEASCRHRGAREKEVRSWHDNQRSSI